MPDETGFADVLMGVDTTIRQQADDIAPDEINASDEQLAEIERIQFEALAKDIYDQLVDQGRSISALNKVIYGIKSDDIIFNVDPQTGESNWQIIPRTTDGGSGGSELPDISITDARKVLSVVVVDEVDGSVAWDKDYVRAIVE